MPDNITKLFKAVADPTRREIFHALVVAASALSISQISNKFEMSRQGVTKHIKTLEEAGLVMIHTRGRERYCFPDIRPLKEINKWLRFYEQFWDDSLQRLEDYLDGKP